MVDYKDNNNNKKKPLFNPWQATWFKIGTNCDPLLADLFLYSYEENGLQLNIQANMFGLSGRTWSVILEWTLDGLDFFSSILLKQLLWILNNCDGRKHVDGDYLKTLSTIDALHIYRCEHKIILNNYISLQTMPFLIKKCVYFFKDFFSANSGLYFHTFCFVLICLCNVCTNGPIFFSKPMLYSIHPMNHNVKFSNQTV